MEALKSILQRVKEEPVAIYGMLTYGIFLATEYGLAIDPGQQAAILGFVAYALTLYTRQNVTSVRNPKATKLVNLVPDE